jgi:hypothetical protein
MHLSQESSSFQQLGKLKKFSEINYKRNKQLKANRKFQISNFATTNIVEAIDIQNDCFV